MTTMKKLTYLIAILVLSSCYKLDTAPYDKVSASSFWKTEEHALQGILGWYDARKDGNLFGQFFFYDNLTDIALGYDIGFGDVIGGAITDRTGSIVNRWQRGFDAIQRTNHAIRNISAMDIEQGSKDVFIGEAKFLRALFYFHLLNLFGGVPLYDETIDL